MMASASVPVCWCGLALILHRDGKLCSRYSIEPVRSLKGEAAVRRQNHTPGGGHGA